MPNDLIGQNSSSQASTGRPDTQSNVDWALGGLVSALRRVHANERERNKPHAKRVGTEVYR